jgi:hypothetical protein
MKNLFQTKKYAFAYGLVFLLFFSCKKDGSINQTAESSSPVAEVNIETALKVAKVFKVLASMKGAPPNIISNSALQNSRQKIMNEQNNSSGGMVDAIDFSKKVIDKYFTVKDMDSVVAMYVINYQTGGFLAVSASKKEHPILAYSDKNSFPQEITKTNHPINHGWSRRPKK